MSNLLTPENSVAIYVGGKGGYALVDKEYYDLVSGYNWQFIKDGYVHNSKVGLMHRLIMNPSKDQKIDHINHNVSDNRRSNLRVCYHHQNVKNRISDEKRWTSKYKGVCWYKKYSLWVSRIGCNGTRIHLGYFADEIEAAKAYDEAAKKLHREFAYLNFK